MRHRNQGFTLIELLIVIAIIAILALIAVPNFLEAQTRAKVSRTLADLNSLSTALEAYFIDQGAYPIGHFARSDAWMLTTPVSYITSLPFDSFLPSDPVGWHPYAPQYFYVCAMPNDAANRGIYEAVWLDWQKNTLRAVPPESAGLNRNIPSPAIYQMRSLGPDKVGNWSYPYSPTNGTVSAGDISLFGPGNVGAPPV